MSSQLQLRRGTTTDISTATGAQGEVFYDTIKKILVTQDGSTVGGFPMLRSDLSNIVSGSIVDAHISSSAAIGAAKIAYKAAIASSTVSRTLLDRLGDSLSVKDFGAKCNSNKLGSTGTDDTAAINAALAAMTNGGTLLVPGFCLISSALNINYSHIRIVGIGNGSSGFVTTSATADIFYTQTSGLSNVEFHDFSIWSTVTKTAGRAFTMTNAQRFVFKRIFAADRSISSANGNRLYDGIYLSGCDDCLIYGCTISGFQNNGITVYGVDAYNSELRITGGTRVSGGTIGILCGGNFGGLYLGEVSVDSAVKDMVINQSLNATINREIFLGDQCVLDACSDTCLEVQANGCSILQLSGAWLASAGKYGTASGNQTCCNILPTNAALRFIASGAHFYNAVNTGLAINGCASANITGCQVDYNTTYGINLANSAIGTVVISGGRIMSNGTGLVIASGVSEFLVQGVDLSGNTTATSITPALSSSKVIANCYGYTSRATGQASFAASATTMTVTHGLSGTPSINDIRLTLLTGTSATWFAITAVTSTTFTVTASAATTSVVTMSWEAHLPGA